MADSSNDTLHGKSVMPSLTVDNVQRSLDFFVGLGFTVEERWGAKRACCWASCSKPATPGSGSVRTTVRRGAIEFKGVGMRLYTRGRGQHR